MQYRRLRERVNRFKKEAVLPAAVRKILPGHRQSGKESD
jgi:hypothetical protein